MDSSNEADAVIQFLDKCPGYWLLLDRDGEVVGLISSRYKFEQVEDGKEA